MMPRCWTWPERETYVRKLISKHDQEVSESREFVSGNCFGLERKPELQGFRSFRSRSTMDSCVEIRLTERPMESFRRRNIC